MRNILAISIFLLFIIAWNIGCVSTNTLAKTSVNLNQDNQETALPVKTANNDKRKLELQLTTKETTCIKSQSCKILLDIHNVSDQNVEIGVLSFWMIPYSTDLRRKFSDDITSGIDLKTLENLGPNESGNHLIIKGNEHLEKEIDIEQIKWQIAKRSSWEDNDLWKRINDGEYQISVRVEQFPPVVDAPRKGKIGNVEVEFIDTYPAESNRLTLDFKRK